MNFLGNGGRSLLGGEGIGVSCGDIENKKKRKKEGDLKPSSSSPMKPPPSFLLNLTTNHSPSVLHQKTPSPPCFFA